MPHAPPVTLPVIELPPQVSVQSTPAFAVSPTGVMLSFKVFATASVVTEPVTPAALATVIGPALAPPDETLPPQPASIRTSAAIHATPHPFSRPIHLAPR